MGAMMDTLEKDRDEWRKEALRLRRALNQIGLACDGPVTYSRSYLANKVADIARVALTNGERDSG